MTLPPLALNAWLRWDVVDRLLPTQARTVLEIGCGQGVSTQLLLDTYGAEQVVAVDLDPAMVGRALRRLSAYGPNRVDIRVGDTTQLEFADASFDAVVDFAALHHVPDWQAALDEIARVLKPGGRSL